MPLRSAADASRRSTAPIDLRHAAGRGRWGTLASGVRTLLIAALSAPLAFGCNTPTASQFAAVRPGMTEAEVEDLLGRPTSTRVVPEDRRDVLGYSQRWMYGDSLSSLATNALFTEGPDERVFVVLFDAQGRVLRTQVPTSGPRELVNKPE